MAKLMKVDITINENNYEDAAKKLMTTLRPGWKPEDICFKVFTEGITNKLFMCTTPALGKADGIVVRIYGAKTDLIIDRQAEIRNINILSELGGGAPLYCQFNNGIAYKFVEGECLDMDTVRDKHISSLVAKEMAVMHKFSVSDINKLGYDIDTSPMVFKKIKNWIIKMPTSFTEPEKDNKLKTEIRSQSELMAEITSLEEQLSGLGCPVVFCHNDLLLKNIVYNRDTNRCYFIDFEYGAFNYDAFDLGNHFDEWAGIDEVDYSLYPGKEVQVPWLRAYLEHKAELEGKSKDSVTDGDVERYYVITNKFALAAHFFWGVWALIQAKYSTIDFDYLDYATIRFGEYFAKKDQFLALQMPQ